MTHEEAVAVCIAFDKANPMIYRLCTVGLSRLGWCSSTWCYFGQAEKMVLVQSNNFFFSADDARAAIARALVETEEKALKMLELLE